MLRVLGRRRAAALPAAPAGPGRHDAAALGRPAPPAGSPRWRSCVPERLGVVDELGELTFGRAARAQQPARRRAGARGVGHGDGVAIMCRNHRGFVDASIAAAKLGADILYLNTAFAGPQLVDVLDREEPGWSIHDEEFTGLLEKADARDRILGWVDDADRRRGHPESLIASRLPRRRPRRARAGQPASIILTSGTTGTPKGAPRSEAGVEAAVALLSRLPLRYGWRTHIAAPLFHTWGWAHFALSMLLGSTVVLRRKFDPEACLRTLVEEDCDSLVVIPVMLQRIMQLPKETLDSYDLSKVKVVAASGSALPGDLGTDWMDQFGDNLYNIYGSTEVAYATIATPADLREAPGYGGQAAVGDDREDPRRATARSCPRGEAGRIFVGNGMLFEGYTGGGSQGGRRRADVHRRRRPLRRRRPPIRRGPRRRDDRLRRGERLPQGGRGLPRPPRGRRRGRPRSASTTTGLRQAAAGLRGPGGRRRGRREDELKDWVKQNLARYKVPREIVFLDELPRNATGKVLKRELAEDDSTTTPTHRSDATEARRDRPDRPRTSRCATSTAQDVDAVVVPGREGGRGDVLPVRVHRVCTGEMCARPRPAADFESDDVRGARGLLRPDVLAARLRRHRTG